MSLIKISDQSTTNQATTTFTGFTTAYDIHVLKIRNVRTSGTNSYLDARFTTATPSAGTPITTTNYKYGSWYDHSQFSIGQLNSTAQSYNDKWRFSYISQNTNGDGYNYEMWIYYAADATRPTFAHWNGVGMANTNAVAHHHGGVSLNQTIAVDGIQIFPISGSHNVAQADITLYGLKES